MSAPVVGLDDAQVLAQKLAQASGVAIRELHSSAEMVQASQLLAEVWGLSADAVQINPDLLIAMAHAGNYVVGAFDENTMVAVSVGFFHAPRNSALHSHITGVRNKVAGKGIGKAIKYHQRAWCLALGVGKMTWTFDPLVARNAFFNIERLGAKRAQYLANFYGTMNDAVNRNQATDRVLLEWDLAAPFTKADTSEASPGEAALLRGADGPVLQLNAVTRAVQCRVEIPQDIELMRREDPTAAAQWRLALRDVLIPLLADGWQIASFDRSGFYRMERN